MQAPITTEDFNSLFQEVKDLLADPLEKSIPSKISDLVEREKNNYKNTIFFFLG